MRAFCATPPRPPPRPPPAPRPPPLSALVQAGRRAASGLRLLEEHVHKRFRDVLRSDRRQREPWVPAQCALGGRATAYIGQAAVHRGQPEGCFRRGSILCLSSRHGRGRGTHRGGVHVCNRRRQSDTGEILRRRFFSLGIRRDSPRDLASTVTTASTQVRTCVEEILHLRRSAGRLASGRKGRFFLQGGG